MNFNNFFRKYNFNPTIDTYDFIIPDDASEEHKVSINIEFAEKKAFDIDYMEYQSDSYDDDELNNPENYGEEKVLVKGYKDGDLVVPDSITNSYSLAKIKVATQKVNILIFIYFFARPK